jgi:TonB family protein
LIAVKNKPKPKKFLQQPVYPGGKKALDEFVRVNLRYPEEALKNNVQGSVTVKFDIDAYGKITDAAVTHGIGYGCDEEALRLVKLLRYQKKIYRGLHVVFHQTIVIHCRLPSTPSQPQKQELIIQYKYSETKPEPLENTTFSYTITPDK